MVAACSGNASAPRLTTTTESAEAIAVPPLAASDELAPADAIREEMSPPWSLTASDGSGLVMTRVDAKAVMEGPLAFTELHLWFHNAEDRIREGTFQITLPQNAAVSRFAMENNGQWMEAEVVEKQIARRAYDDALHRRQDPALLEKAAGNQFTAKVFPIPARGDKHIVISYSQELPGAQYVLPLRGLPKAQRVDVSLAVTDPAGKRVDERLSERDWVADRDFVSSVGRARALSADGYVVAQVEVGQELAQTAQAPAGVTILVDTSASRALGFTSYVRQIRGLVDSLRTTWGATLPVQVVAFDQDAEMIFNGQAYELGDAHIKKLLERGAAGASDLGQALAWTAQHAPLQRVVVVTDGVITAGDEGDALAKQVSALASVKVERIDFAVTGGLRDEAALATLVRHGLQRPGSVLDLDKDPVATAIAEPVALDTKIEIAGADWVYPRVIPTARAGQRTTVYARLARPQQALDVMVAGKAQHLDIVSGTGPLVSRAAAAAEIAELDAVLLATTDAKRASELRTSIAKKSVASRVISSQTSLLVLESDSDYATYGIDRRALADILVVGTSGIELRGRTQIARPQQPPRNNKQIAANESAEDSGGKNKDKKEAGAAMPSDGFGMGTSVEASRGGAAGESTSVQPEAMPDAKVASAAGPSMGPPPAPSAAPPPPPRTEAASRPATAVPPREVREERQERRRDVSDDALSASEDGPSGQLAAEREPERPSWPPPDAPPALTGQLAQIQRLIRSQRVDDANGKAPHWHTREPGNVLALIGLGDALEAKATQGSLATAARVYGSIIDLFPGRADMRRFAGERLSRLTDRAKDLIVDTYRRAVADRPDHMTGHRLLAYALVRAGKPDEAFAAILAAIDRSYRGDSYAGGERVLRDDAGMIGPAYGVGPPGKKGESKAALAKRHLTIATRASTRFILYWETDANDVDFHIQDAKGGHAFYGAKQLPSGGELYADITTGYGPECFAIQGTPKAGPYHLSIDYYSQGPMGFGMGLLEIQRFDGKGHITFEDRPYVIMNDHAYADLGLIR